MIGGIRTILLVFLLNGWFSMAGQTKPPTGPAAEKIIKAYSSGDLNGIVATFSALEKAWPDHPFTHFFKAFIADRKDNNVNEALREYSTVIKMAPDLSDPFLFRAIIFNEKGMYEKAVEDMSKAIELEGDGNPNLFSLRGDIYSNAGKNEEAFADFKKGISLDPAIAKNYRGLMNTGLELNKNTELMAIIKNAVSGSELKNGAVWEVWGDMNLRTKAFAEADKAYSNALSLNPAAATADTYNNAAIAALNTNSFPRAKSLSEKAITLEPGNYLLYTVRAEISTKDKSWEEVYEWAKKALAINEKTARGNMLMAVGVKLTGRGDTLSADYQQKAKAYEAQGLQ